MTYITKVTTSGNSQAARLPSALLKMSNLGDTVELEAKDGEIIIRNASRRAGWKKAIEETLAKHNDPSIEFGSNMDAVANDGLDDLPWVSPSYEDWLKANDKN